MSLHIFGKPETAKEPKPPADAPLTRDEVKDIAIGVTEFYVAQTPGFVQTMIGAALQGYDQARRDGFSAAMSAARTNLPKRGTIRVEHLTTILDALDAVFGVIPPLALVPDNPIAGDSDSSSLTPVVSKIAGGDSVSSDSTTTEAST